MFGMEEVEDGGQPPSEAFTVSVDEHCINHHDAVSFRGNAYDGVVLLNQIRAWDEILDFEKPLQLGLLFDMSEGTVVPSLDGTRGPTLELGDGWREGFRVSIADVANPDDRDEDQEDRIVVPATVEESILLEEEDDDDDADNDDSDDSNDSDGSGAAHA